MSEKAKKPLRTSVLSALVWSVLIGGMAVGQVPDVNSISLMITKSWRAGALEAEPYEIWGTVVGNGITSVTVTPPGGTAIALEDRGGWWKIDVAPYATLAGLRGDFPTGDYVFTFNGGADSATVPHNPLEPTGFANVTWPIDGALDVPVDTTYSWSSCVGYGDNLHVDVGDEDTDVLLYESSLGIGQTWWDPGPLNPGHWHSFEVAVLKAATPQPLVLTTDHQGDSFNYYDVFEYNNEILFRTAGATGVDVHNITLCVTEYRTDGVLGSTPYEFSAVVSGDGIASVTMTPPGGVPITLNPWHTGPGDWGLSVEDYTSLPALRADFPIGNYVFTFNAGTDSAIVSHNPAVPTGFANITYPVHTSVNVPLNPTFTWDSCAGYGDALNMAAGEEAGGMISMVHFADITETAWALGLLNAGVLHWLEVSVFAATAQQPYPYLTVGADNFGFYDLFEKCNEVRFTTTSAPVLMFEDFEPNIGEPTAPFYDTQTAEYTDPGADFAFIKNTEDVNSWAGENYGAVRTVAINDNADSEVLGVPSGGFYGQQGVVLVYEVSGENISGSLCALSAAFRADLGGPGGSGLPFYLSDATLEVDIDFTVPSDPSIQALPDALGFWLVEEDGDSFESGRIITVTKGWNSYVYELGNLADFPSPSESEGVFGDSPVALLGLEFRDPNMQWWSESEIVYFVDNFLIYIAEPISDHVFFTAISEGLDYQDPCDANDLRYVFSFEIVTDYTVELVEFLTPAGNTFEIPSDQSTQSGDVATWRSYEDGLYRWGYEGRFADPCALDAYGDGEYTITVHYDYGGRSETAVWYGVPGTSSPIRQPTDEPVLTFPIHDGNTISPVTFTWQPCTDGNAAEILLALEEEGAGEEMEFWFGKDQTSSDRLTLTTGSWQADIQFLQHFSTLDGSGGFDVELSKYSEAHYSFELLPPPAEIEVGADGANIEDGQPEPIDFGIAVQNSSEPALTFTVENTGGRDLEVGTVYLNDNNGFQIIKQPDASVGPYSWTTFSLKMLTGTAGGKSADVEFLNSDSDENPFNFKVAGTVLEAYVDLVGDVRYLKRPPSPVISQRGADIGVLIGVSNLGNFTVGSMIDIEVFARPCWAVGDLNDILLVAQADRLAVPGPGVRVEFGVKTGLPPGMEPGEYVIGVRVDSSAEVEESNEQNNTALMGESITVVEGYVDLIGRVRLGYVSEVPVISQRGAKLSLSVKVGNMGNYAVPGMIDIKIFARALGAVDDSEDVLLRTIVDYTFVPAPGSGRGYIVGTRLPPGMEPGEYFIGVKVDSSNEVVESNEQNNTALTGESITVVEGYVDLIGRVWLLQRPPSEMVSGGITAIKLEVRMYNIGNLPVGRGQRVDIEIFARPLGAVDDSEDVVVRTVATRLDRGLAPGGSLPLRRSVYLPPGMEAGDYVLGAKVDSANDVAESDEENNTHIAPVPIRVIEGYVDLIGRVKFRGRLPDYVASGSMTPIDLEVRLYNTGTSRADAGQRMDIEIFARPLGAVGDSEDVLIMAQPDVPVPLPRLGPRVYSKRVYLPPGMEAGRYVLGVKVDSSDEVAESNEDNNTSVAKGRITVVEGYVDLVGRMLFIGPPPRNVVSGSTTPIELEVRAYNIGTSRADEEQQVEVEIFARLAGAVDDSEDVLIMTEPNVPVPLPRLSPYIFSRSVYLPAGMEAGEYVLGVTVDCSNEVDESNEQNNTWLMRRSITVTQ